MAARQLREIGAEFRERRLSLGSSQAFVASAAHISRSRYSMVEAGATTTLSIVELNRLAAVLGMETSVRLYPGGTPTRDAGHAGKLGRLLQHARPPLGWKVEVPLPMAADRWERRAWDACIYGAGERTAIELEMRLRDVQAMRRRHELKRRDDPSEHFLLVVADTRHNRRVVADFEELFAELPRLRPSVVHVALAAARHPLTGLLFV